MAPGDEPGARTIGAMALKRWVARGPGRGDSGDEAGDSPATYGPFDEADLDHEHALLERVDFGAVRVPVPHDGEVSVEPEDGRLQAVHVMLPAGRLSVSALAAPRTERLWPDLAAEIDESLREGGATVRSFTGAWGRELHARTGDASSLFVGVDGPRWMLYGVATGPTSSAEELDVALRVMLRGTVVVRGRSPYPVRTVLPLTVPEQLPLPDRVPVPRMPADRAPAPRRTRPAPMADAPTTITPVADGVDTVPHGIPRRVPGTISEVEAPAGPAAGRSARPAAAGPPEPSPTTDDDPAVETGASRTLSRGLFRRKPERPQRTSNRPPQRRVSELLAEAERERTATPRPGSGPRRPVGADGDDAARFRDRQEPGRATSASGPPPGGSVPPAAERRPPDGQGVNGSRADGFVPREPAHDRFGSSFSGATAYGAPDHGARHDASPADGRVDGGSTNGSAFGSPADGSHATGSYVNGSYGDAPYANGSYGDRPYANGSHVDPRIDETSVNGVLGSHPDEPFGPDWPSLGGSGYGASTSSPERDPSGRSSDHASSSDDWSLGYGSSGPDHGGAGMFGIDPGTESGFGTDHRSRFGADPDLDLGHRPGLDDGPDAGLGLGLGLGVDNTIWAATATGIGDPRGSGLAADGADDWTLPLPVIRSAPPPEPVPDPVVQAPRSRRARRAAEEAVGPEPWAAERRTPDERAPNGRTPNGRSAGGRVDESWAADDREPGRATGGRSSGGPRYGGGHRAPEPDSDRATRASRRNGSAHTRHAEEWADEWDGVPGPVDRGRHRRPEH